MTTTMMMIMMMWEAFDIIYFLEGCSFSPILKRVPCLGQVMRAYTDAALLLTLFDGTCSALSDKLYF